jgi:hypothetical protein
MAKRTYSMEMFRADLARIHTKKQISQVEEPRVCSEPPPDSTVRCRHLLDPLKAMVAAGLGPRPNGRER